MTGILNTTSLSRAAAAALSALLLSGCAALSGGGSEAIPADAMKRPVDLSVVCVLVNEDVKSEPLVKSLETGVRSFGSEPRLLMPGDGPQACSFVVTYEVRTNARAIEAVRFQTFEIELTEIAAGSLRIHSDGGMRQTSLFRSIWLSPMKGVCLSTPCAKVLP